MNRGTKDADPRAPFAKPSMVFYIGNTVKLLNQRHCRRTHGATRAVGRPVKRHGTVTTWDDHGIQCTHAAAHCAPLDFIVGALLCHFVLSRSLSLSPRRRARSIFPRVPSETEESDCDTRDYFYSRTEPPLLSFVRVNYPCFVRVNHRRRYPPPANRISRRDSPRIRSALFRFSKIERGFLCKFIVSRAMTKDTEFQIS